MSWRINEAWRAIPGRQAVLIGHFTTIVVPEHSTGFTRAEPIERPMVYVPGGGAAPMERTIPTHTFRIEMVRSGIGSRLPALVVKLGEPVEWLHGWTWRDPLWLKVWRGQAPDCFR